MVRPGSFLVHGVNGIGHQVDKYLFQTIVLGQDMRNIRIQVQFDFDIVNFQLMAQDSYNFV